MTCDNEGGCVTYSQYTRFAHIIEMRHTVYMPMKLYIAGKNLARASRVGEELQCAGCIIPCNWYDNYTDDETNFSPADEVAAIRAADALIYLWEADQESARYEAGMAIALGKPIIVVYKAPSWFLRLPQVRAVASDDEIMGALAVLRQELLS